ncbi:RidA family protein [Spirosoma sp. KNUC1025]|uniref:RidA family protein n=1 Tax=Spirosoma sp. KNUC1025 TaxID=2894082 RepID=UPI00386CEC33|nr:RidA family protein [Spirosoma sp. KNUC1025]
MPAQRRSILKQLFTSVTSVVGLGVATPDAAANSQINATSDKEGIETALPQDVPLYSSMTKMGNMIFIFGIGAHFEGDIKSHTDHVLKEMEKELVKAGSSMEKVLKVSVFLHDLEDYKGMNDVFKGRFGSKPPVRTTVAPHAGVPGDSLVEMDCIAYV